MRRCHTHDQLPGLTSTDCMLGCAINVLQRLLMDACQEVQIPCGGTRDDMQPGQSSSASWVDASTQGGVRAQLAGLRSIVSGSDALHGT